MSDPLFASGEAASFYAPLINDPTTSGTWFIGLQHVWRTTDNAGARASLDLHCNEFFGDFAAPCGDWAPLGGRPVQASPAIWSALSTAQRRAGRTSLPPCARQATRTRCGRQRGAGGCFVSKNANAANPALATFTRIDGAAQPRRFVSGIAVDPTNPNHAYVSFSGYDAYTPTTPGHVFEVVFNPTSGTAAWTNISYDLGDQPITSVAFDPDTGDIFAATDFGVVMLPCGTTDWRPAAHNLPPVAVYGLTMDSDARVL